ncbi:bifunctional tetrahydrofolate synthase/dihydrofolate synthase [Rickettsiella endosymbiont of Miltochrista miniata]|uniref:bifunctional tetrahydrofolate synthase/dihydrofolate synthase n=1 Tax=Rickettsiella endosymbiont of Miltochrista miniata TaxID=3066239 RepID=UPI00313ADAB8
MTISNELSLDSRTLSDWLAYIDTCHPSSIDLGLERISQVAERLQVLHFNCPVVTVAGTNGKGSNVALTAAILTAAGYRVGTYTSPHLIRYQERIQIAGHCISDQDLCRAFLDIEKNRADISLTYFEIGTLAALWTFKHAALDAIILEIGLGGRLDAVNCVDADLAIISMIDLDHMDWLGDTREKIGFEKAGIMRPNRPCVCGDFAPPQSLLNTAQSLASPLYRQGIEFDYKMQGQSWSWTSQQLTLRDLPLPNIDLQNAATVLQAIELLGDHFIITPLAIQEGLKRVFIPGRFHLIEKNARQIIIDVAHNPAGGECLSKRLANTPCLGNTYAVAGMLADKDIINTLRPLRHHVDHWTVCDLAEPRGAKATQLKQALLDLEVSQSILEFSSPDLAFQYAYRQLQKNDRLLVFGSFHTAAAIYLYLDS